MSARDDYPALALMSEFRGRAGYGSEIVRALREIDRLRAEVERLTPLAAHARHGVDCTAFDPPVFVCTCGLDALVAP